MSEKTESELLALFKNGDKEAADELLGRYFDRVVRAAHRRIAQRRLRGTDSEDVALSVFESLWKKADNNHFDENDLTRPDDITPRQNVRLPKSSKGKKRGDRNGNNSVNDDTEDLKTIEPEQRWTYQHFY